MADEIVPIGEVTVGQCIPTAVTAFAAVEGNLNAQLAAAGNLRIALNVGPPSLAVATQIGATATVQAIASVTSPYFGLAIDANLTTIAAINAQLAALAGIIAALGTAGVQLYAYHGTAGNFGTTVQGELSAGLPGGGPSDHVDALLLVAKTPAAWAAIQATMKTS